MPKRRYRRLVLIALATLTFLPAARGSAEEYYFALIFGSETRPKQLRLTHTWATFVKASGTGPDLSTYALEEVTISWLPATLSIRVFAHDPEPGVNLGLHQTLRYVRSQREFVTVWGPFVVTPLLYERALAQAARLRAGVVRYRAISSPFDQSISGCIHAVSDVDPMFGRWNNPLIRVGIPASRHIAE
ncbi:MAG: hypothetical protein AB7I30_14610, partial [Isosphaeraceae bacterium]